MRSNNILNIFPLLKAEMAQYNRLLSMDLDLETAIENANGIGVIAKAIKTNIYNPKICNYGINVLLTLSRITNSDKPRELSNQIKLIKEGAIEIALMGMTIHIENSEVCKGCSGLISVLAETSGKL